MSDTRIHVNLKYRKVPTVERLGYGAGHIYNDMVAAFLLSFIAVYVKVGLKLDAIYAGYVLFVILITDAVTRPLIILVSRKFNLCKCIGKRKSLHLIGMILLTASVVLSFSTLFGGDYDKIVRFFLYVPIFVLLATTFTCVQVSHKAILRQMTGLTSEKVFISMWRTMSSLAANIAVFIVATVFLAVQGNTESSAFVDDDEIIFRNISYFIIAVGVVCSVVFYIFVPEQRTTCRCLCISKDFSWKRQNALKRKSQASIPASPLTETRRKSPVLRQLNVNELKVRTVQVETKSLKDHSSDKALNTTSLPKIIVTNGNSKSNGIKAIGNNSSLPGGGKSQTNKTKSSKDFSPKSHKVDTKANNERTTVEYVPNLTSTENPSPKVSTVGNSSKSDSTSNIPKSDSTSNIPKTDSTSNIPKTDCTSNIPKTDSVNVETSGAKTNRGYQNLSVIAKLKLLLRSKRKEQSEESGNNSPRSQKDKKDKLPTLSTFTKIKAAIKKKSNVINNTALQQSGPSNLSRQPTVDNTSKASKLSFRTVGAMALTVNSKQKWPSQTSCSQSPNSIAQSNRKNSKPKLSTVGRIAVFFKTKKVKGQPDTSTKRGSVGDKSKQLAVPQPTNYRKYSTASVTGRNKKKWYTGMCKKPKFYKTAVIHACSRLALVVSQVFMPLYLTETLMMDKIAIAVIPLIIYVSGFATSVIMRKINQKYGRKRSYAIGEAATLGAAIWLFLIHKDANYQVYMAAILLGVGLSTMQVRTTSMVTDLTGSPVDSGAAFFSVNEKVIQAIAIVLLQIFNPCGTASTQECSNFYRNVMLSMTGGSTFLGFVVMTLAKVLGLETEEANTTSLEVTEDGVGISSGI